ncbi:hypothetical protein TRVA0_008S01596 [Trichomonascus vanleenenianus]|uniref:uncharacterized protein n=1 Tax=Trichomonascus vanleenenianus TaxID=2268995 RepID=UPI003ECA52E3
MIGLAVKAELQGVTDFTFRDSVEEPYEFTFKIQCTSCREIHGNEVRINQYEKHQIGGSRGEASFVFRCKMCKRESSATIKTTGRAFTIEDMEPAKGTKKKDAVLLEIDPRGIDFVEFIPVGMFKATGVESDTSFEFELEDGEWFDYDDKAGEEVSITDVKWEFVKI